MYTTLTLRLPARIPRFLCARVYPHALNPYHARRPRRRTAMCAQGTWRKKGPRPRQLQLLQHQQQGQGQQELRARCPCACGCQTRGQAAR